MSERDPESEQRRPARRLRGSAIADKAAQDEQGWVDEMQRLEDSVKDFTDGKARAAIYMKPNAAVGTWKFCDDAARPLDFQAILGEMRERFGAGDYEIRMYGPGGLKAAHPFSIAKERTLPVTAAPAAAPGFGQSELFAMMMSQGAEAWREASAAADRQNQLMLGLATTLAPLLLQQKAAPPPTSIADTLALVAAVTPKGDKTSLQDMVATLVALRDLAAPAAAAGGGGVEFDPEDLVASGARLIGPLGRALADFLATRRGEAGALNANGTGAPGAAEPLALNAPASRFRVLNLVRDDILYGYGRGHDPAKVADLVYDVIVANAVTEAEINELALTFALSPAGLDDLAREGIDIRGRPGWAGEFFAALQSIHTDETDDSGGEGGGGGDPGADGKARSGGEAGPANP